MPGMADQDQRAPGGHILAPLHVNLGDERAGRVQHVEAARFRVAFDRLGDAMRAENRHGALGHFIEFFDETRAFLTQIVDHVAIVDNFVAHVHGRAVLLQRPIDNLDCTNNARAKAAGLGKDDSHMLADSD
jgi:hypothetical protein